MKYPRAWLLIAALLAACSQPGSEINYMPLKGVYPDLQEIAIAEFKQRGIDYRVADDGIVEVDYARADDIAEIVTRIWETHLPRERSFSINPAFVMAFRQQLDEESIPYRTLRADGLHWTVVEEGDERRASEIKDLVVRRELEQIDREENSPLR